MDRNQINPLEFARLQNLDDTSEMMLCLRIGWKWNGMLLGHREDNLPKFGIETHKMSVDISRGFLGAEILSLSRVWKYEII
jgi:hypothetical protein